MKWPCYFCKPIRGLLLYYIKNFVFLGGGIFKVYDFTLQILRILLDCDKYATSKGCWGKVCDIYTTLLSVLGEGFHRQRVYVYIIPLTSKTLKVYKVFDNQLLSWFNITVIEISQRWSFWSLRWSFSCQKMIT